MPIQADFEQLLSESDSGHPHFWQRAMSRRQFIGTSAAATAGAITAPLWIPTLADADASDPKPIPQTISTPFGNFHTQPPAPGVEPSSITDFMGVVGVAAVTGAGTATNVITGASERLKFGVHNAFMKGAYVGASGHTYHATFAFV